MLIAYLLISNEQTSLLACIVTITILHRKSQERRITISNAVTDKMVLAVIYPTILNTIVKALCCNIIINCVINRYVFIFMLV